MTSQLQLVDLAMKLPTLLYPAKEKKGRGTQIVPVYGLPNSLAKGCGPIARFNVRDAS